MVTGNFVDVYPDPEHGKQPGGYTIGLCSLKSPALVFLNYNGTIRDQKTITHELGHGINFYLIGNSVDYFYCSGQIYEMEIPSTFNEELLLITLSKTLIKRPQLMFSPSIYRSTRTTLLVNL